MARAKSNGNGRLDESITALNQAMATLAQAQATLVQNQAAFLARIAETDARMAELERQNAARNAVIDERFARIEAILLEHTRILRSLPDAIREKIGFKAPENRPAE
jgi:hypothetical protein